MDEETSDSTVIVYQQQSVKDQLLVSAISTGAALVAPFVLVGLAYAGMAAVKGTKSVIGKIKSMKTKKE